MEKKTVKQVKKKRKKKNIKKNKILKRIAKIKKYLIKYKRNMCKKKKKKKAIKKRATKDVELHLLSYKEYKGIDKVKVFFKNRKMVISDDMKKFKKKLKYGTLKDKVLIIIMLGLVALFSLGIIFCVYIIITAPEVSEKRLYKSNSTVLYDVNGNEFKRLGLENREKVSYEQLPQVLVDAIVATEDSRFFQHNGIDIARFSKAVFGQLLGRSDAGGGSTLTMQVSKNAATDTTSHGIGGIIRKFTDIYLSVFVFEKRYTKEEIMEFYVNIPNLGSGTYGVEQASKTYFGKDVSELNLGEAAMIAGLFQAPSAYNPYVNPKNAEARRNTVLNLMCRHGYITEEERDTAKSVPVESLLVGKGSSLNKYVGFIDTVVEEVIERTKTKANPTGDDPYSTSMKIWTTLDPAKQDVINELYAGTNKNGYKWPNDVAQAGIAVVSVEDGSIVAVGAGRNKKTERSLNYATSTRHHPGSTAKPIMDYGPAIEYLNWSTGQTIIDDDYTYTGGGQIKNFDNKHKGVMTIKNALAQSRNIPALYTFQQTTNEQKLEFASNLGWKPETSSGTILETCSIGGFDGVTPLEAAAAYATFARGGTYIEPYSVTKIEYTETGDTIKVTPKKITAMSEETAYMINMILKHAVTSNIIGAGSVSGTDIAAKTGTSTVDSTLKKEFKGIIGDSWEIAYSPDYAIATWYGYPQRTKEYYLKGTEGGKARREITKFLVTRIMKKNSRFNRPNGIVEAEIELGTDPLKLASPATPKELRSVEYFKKGTVPTTVSNRFDTLSDPSNLKFTNNNGVVTLTWNAATTPNAINETYLREYFTNSTAYKVWAEKYLQQRIAYNNNTFGSFGYQVYMVANGITTDLGFTTNTTFTTNINTSSKVSFIVKSSYQKFKNNQSTGLTINVTEGASSNGLNIEYKGSSCSTLENFNSLGANPKNKVKVTENETDVTDNSTISYVCKKEDGAEIDCSTLASGVNYSIIFTAKYNGLQKTKTINLKNTCN